MNHYKAATAYRCSLVLLCGLFLPDKVYAHLMSTGFGPFYDGVIHLTMSPDELLGILALALLAGLAGASYGRKVLFFLTSAWLAGGITGLQLDQEISLPLVNALSLCVVGLFVALDYKLPLWLITGLSIILGLFNGFFNGSAMSQAGGGILALLGILAGVFVTVTIAAAFVISLHQTWARVCIRIAGSWIAAIGLLLLGWTFRGGLSP